MQSYTFEVQSLKYVDGKGRRVAREIRVDVPTDPTEITLRQWANFAGLRAEAPKWLEQIVTDGDIDLVVPDGGWRLFVPYAMKVICCLACNSEELIQDELLLIPFGDYDQGTDGLLALLSMILKPIHEYEPKERTTFSHNNIEYAMYTTYIDKFDQTWVANDIRVAEAVDSLQFEQVFFQKDSKGELLQEDAVYRNLLALTCMLSRKIGDRGFLENPPVGLADRTVWMDKRIDELSGVDMTVGLDIDFFLPSSKTALLNILTLALRGQITTLQRHSRREKRKGSAESFSSGGDGT